MNTKKIIAMILSLAIVLGLAACGNETEPTTTAAPNTTAAPTPTTTAKPTEPAPTEPVETDIEDGDVSVTFDDGNFGFVNMYDGRANADASTLEIVEVNGNNALKVINGSGKVPYVAIDVWGLLGENAANVASVEMMLGIENPDGKFYACSGSLILWQGGKLSSTTYDWSVYLQKKNPKVATFTLADYEAFSADNSVAVLTLSTDNGATAGAANANLLIYNITFKDANGNILTADTTATFNAPEGFGGSKDMSNLMYLKNTVSLDAMSGISGGAWGQNGIEMTEDFLAALVPGSVIEIEYTTTSATGDLWIVMPWAEIGWTRVCQQSATKNGSNNICQITFEQIAAACGTEDIAKWGAMLQCESDGDWQVYSVKVGQNSGLVTTTQKVALEGSSFTGGAWGQNGIELTDDQIALLKAGCVIEIAYSSTMGDMWIVLPDAAAGWTRIEQQTAACDGATCQITFEQIAAVLGEDVSQWFANSKRLQCESSGDWEVYSVSICGGVAVNVAGAVDLGIACTGGAWGQAGADLTAEQMALLVPGSVITIQYTSTVGNLWIVLPDAAAGWTRIEQQTANCDGETCWITFEQIAAVLGEDVSQWFANGARLQFESEGDWEVYSVSIGTGSGASTETPDQGGSEENPGEEQPTPEIPVPEIPAVPEGSLELYSGTTALSGWQMVAQINTTVWGGTVDPATFTDGGYFTVYFTGVDVYSMHVCLNGGGEWTQIDCELANAVDLGDGTYAATFYVADMFATYGTTDLSGLGAVMVYSNSDAAGYAIVTLVTYTPAP